jgi:hypothetical protein
MADRFPLIVNAISKKIEEIVSGDNLELTGNGIVVSGDTGAGKYLTSDGTQVLWDSPGDVYLTQTQTLTNKTLETCTISGSVNTLTNIPNSALVNSGITVNGTTIALGGSVTTPDNNTTYSVSAADGLSATEKIIRLTSGGNSGAGIQDNVSVVAGTNVSLSRTGDAITINSSYVDTNTVTRLQSATGGALVSGDITIAASGSSTVSQSGNTITVSSTYIDTITRLRATTGQVFTASDFTFLDGGATTVSQGVDGNGDPTITYSSTDTITRVKGGSAGAFNSGDIELTGAGDTVVTQSGNTITVSSTDSDTVTRIRGTTSGALTSGDITFIASGATSITQTGSTIEISSVNTDTGATLNASGGLILQGNNFQMKNYINFSDNSVMKWDNSNQQLVDSIIEDDGSTVTIGGDLVVTGTTTTIDSTTLVVADNNIELRKGANLVGADGGITVNRTTDSNGSVVSFTSLEWYETGNYWRTYNGSTADRLVTEGATQILTDKTLDSPILNSPTLGVATATSVNGLTITTTASGVLTIANAKTLTVNNTLTLSGTDGSSVDFRNGGSVAYVSDTLAVFASTTSTQLRGIITDSTGVGVLVFNTNPIFLTSVTTNSTAFNVFNSTATTINAFGAATSLTMSVSGGTTTLRGNLDVDEDVTFGSVVGDTFTVNSTPDFVNSDIIIRGTSANPIKIGRGGNEIASNTRVGFTALENNTTGSQNTAFGFEAGLTVNSGAANTVMGYRALRNGGIASENVAIGKDAMLTTTSGDQNVCLGVSAGGTLTSSNANVFIGHYAGYGATGTGNVLIGPADTEDSTSATYNPIDSSGDRQLVIGSGTETWVRGDQFFNVTLPNNVTVGGDTTIEGDLTVNGTTTTINSSTLTIDDKTIELASVQQEQFSASITNNSVNLSNITPVDGLIVGMQASIITAGISVPAGTIIASIDHAARTAVLDQPVSGTTGSAVFSANGPFDTSADGAGVVVKGTTDKTITWTDATDAWTLSEHVDIPQAKEYRVGNVLVAKNGQIGPSSGAWSLGAGVLSSSLTSIGVLTSLTVNGNSDFSGGTGYLRLPNGTTAEQPGQSGAPTAAEGMLRWNTTTDTFEGYDGSAWGKIGGGAAVSATAPTGANSGDLWYDSDLGRMFVYYIEGNNNANWVDAAPNGTPTDLVVDGTGTFGGAVTVTGDITATDDLVANDEIRNSVPADFWASDNTYISLNNYGNITHMGGFETTITSNGYRDTNGDWQSLSANGTTGAAQIRLAPSGSIAFGTEATKTSGTSPHNVTTRLQINNVGHVLPGVDATQDLGSATKRWANIYSADLQLSNEGAANDVDGTWGQYTIQEGEEDLFLINRRSGKKYKFNLTEVN